jgi:hypothetical protein
MILNRFGIVAQIIVSNAQIAQGFSFAVAVFD